jgi:uncharacterized protein YbjT (DUF2867 family)
MKVLITGATGALGRRVARMAMTAGHSVVALSHRVSSPKFRDAGWVLGDLTTGEGLQTAMRGVDAIIHTATDPRRTQAVDVEGTQRLVDAARAERVGHFVHVSIAGIDDMPVAYYRGKREAEQIVMGSGVPYSILRATRFHHFVDRQLRTLAAIPFVMPLPKDVVVQSVDVDEVAARLMGCLDERSAGRLADFGGPHVLPLAEMAAVWLRIHRIRKRVINVPLPGATAAAFGSQMNTAPLGVHGKVSWREWLLRHHTMNVSEVSATGLEKNPLDFRNPVMHSRFSRHHIDTLKV